MHWGIWHWLERRADISPDHPALIDAGRTAAGAGRALTYRSLAARVASLAGALREQGIRRGDRVAILSMNRPEYVEVLFASARLGAMVVPLNWRLTPAELAFQIEDSEPSCLFLDEALHTLAEGVRALPESRGIRSFLSFEGERYEELLRSRYASPEGHFEDPFLIMYTSGTTGRPKGAVLTQATQLWNSVNIGGAISLTQADVSLNMLPMFHTGGIGLLTLPSLHTGATAVLLPKFDAADVVRMIRQYGVTVMFGVPSIYLTLLESPAFREADLSRVRFSCGGAPCPLTIIEAFRQRGLLFQQGYGLTETAPTCLIIPARDAFRKAGSAGKPAIHAEVCIVDEDGRNVRPGEIGEIWARGPNMFSGYWRRPQATKEAFAPPAEPIEPADDYAGWWFRTGDLARMDEEGFIYIVDRKKDMVISGGENIYPAEVEEVLSRHPAIAEAAVIGMPDARWGEVPMAIVALRPGQTLTAEQLARFCDEKLARYKIPKSMAIVDALPRNAAGKVLKRVLRDQFAASPGVQAS